MRRLSKWLVYATGLAAGACALVVLVFALQARARLPDLEAWHRVELIDFRAGSADAPTTFAEYRALEERLFADLRTRLLQDPAAADAQALSRFNPDSVVARIAWDTVYNRSFELAPEGEPRGSALLVHGLTDSPYSLRGIAETLQAQGYYVVVLRMPGHGTAPSGLVDVSWEDWYAAVELAARHAATKAGPGKPFVAGGHSTGAALVTLYSLQSLEDPELPRPEDLYLVSAAIGISPFAVLTNVLSGLSFIPYFEKSRWMDVLPEYDPYKYNSFPVNAANQVHSLTHVVQERLDELEGADNLAAMPRVHLFQSIVDSTVTADEVVRGLLARLPAGGHELVVFDINREQMLEGFVARGPLDDLERLRAAVDLPFRITLVANASADDTAVAAYVRAPGTRAVTIEALPYAWPHGVFSVGHVSLPFPPDDPVYGLVPPPGTTYNLGGIAARGESGALVVGLGTFTRLRSNPFFDVITARIVETLP